MFQIERVDTFTASRFGASDMEGVIDHAALEAQIRDVADGSEIRAWGNGQNPESFRQIHLNDLRGL